jgi:YspA, cpYpsA-related SLOG family
MNDLRVIFCGDRNWSDRGWITQVMTALKDNLGNFTVIEGEARGADSIARDVAESLGLPVLKFPADWDKYRKAAGPIRNNQMLTEGRADGVVAFHLDIQQSKGTTNMIIQARTAGRPCWICTDGPVKLIDFILELKRLKNG